MLLDANLLGNVLRLGIALFAVVLRMPGVVPGVQEVQLLVNLSSSSQNVSGKDLNSSIVMG